MKETRRETITIAELELELVVATKGRQEWWQEGREWRRRGTESRWMVEERDVERTEGCVGRFTDWCVFS